MSETIPAEFHELFEKRTFAHFSTLTPEGSPHVTPVWIDYDPDQNRLLVNTERGRRKERNVEANPSVGLSMIDPDDPYRMLSVSGEVETVTTAGAREHIDELARRYTGNDEYGMPIQTERVIMRIRPDEVMSWGIE